MLRARANRIGQVFGLRRGHHEDDLFRGLLERFQKGVGGLVGEHVRFVEDHDLVARSRRGITHHLAQFADLVDAAVRSGVDLDDVKRGSRGDLTAGIAGVAGINSRTFDAVQGFGEDARRSGLAHAAPAGKNVSVRHAIVADGVRERLGDVLLPDDVAKRLRAPFPRNDLIAHEEMLAALHANDERNFGWSAAPEPFPLPLLPSGPGGVCGDSLHRARSSTHRQSRRCEIAIAV